MEIVTVSLSAARQSQRPDRDGTPVSKQKQVEGNFGGQSSPDLRPSSVGRSPMLLAC